MGWRSKIVIISLQSKRLAACVLLLKVLCLWYPILLSGGQSGRWYTLWPEGSRKTSGRGLRQQAAGVSLLCGCHKCDKPRKPYRARLQSPGGWPSSSRRGARLRASPSSSPRHQWSVSSTVPTVLILGTLHRALKCVGSCRHSPEGKAYFLFRKVEEGEKM